MSKLNVEKTLDGKNIVLIGSTGFVGKVALAMILDKYPNIGQIFALVRPGMGAAPEDRFFGKVVTSEAFNTIKERLGEKGFDELVRKKVTPIAGDIGKPLCQFEESDFKMFDERGGIDAVINSAGLVSFTPSLESAIRINAMGAKNCLELSEKLGAKLVHVSTCYVAGRRDGEVWENEDVVGYYPRHNELRDDDFDADKEIEDCQRVIDQTKKLANDRRHISMFRERAEATLLDQKRNADIEGTLRLAVARERKLWIHQELTRIGMERSDHWGWTNTYTYTKSLGEQIILKNGGDDITIVRPAIVESGYEYPFPGWNEGFNTTAPLIYLVLKGHRQIVAGDETPLDVIPVDMVCAAIIMATAAVLEGCHEKVYQCGTSGINPISTRRLTELSGLAVRRYRKALAEDGEDPISNKLKARLEAFPVTEKTFSSRSAPLFNRLAKSASKKIDENLPKWGAPRLQAWAERTQEELGKLTEFTDRVVDLIDLFKPFTTDHDIRYRADHVFALYNKCEDADKAKLPWTPEKINWRDYWLDTHFEGLKKYVFPVLDDEFGVKPRSVYTYKELQELFNAAVKLGGHRVAFRQLSGIGDEREVKSTTYKRAGEVALWMAGHLQSMGVEPKDNVFLMGENCPEWPMAFFAVIHSAATAVPVDSGLSYKEVVNLLKASESKVAVFTEKVAERLVKECAPGNNVDSDNDPFDALDDVFAKEGLSVKCVWFDEMVCVPPKAAVKQKVRGDSIASLIYTSGTTGTPKGVKLTHKNLTSMASKLSSTFRLFKHDSLLSVLPLHHTFEFSAGMLMPFCHGAAVNYLEEIDSETLSDAFASKTITGLVGVPALWQLLHRKITKRVAERGPFARKIFEVIMDANRQLSEVTPYGLDFGKVVFFPVHRQMGGRLRLLISGGSALSADVMKDFQGLGFSLYEGYGMTEASPVITVQRPGEMTPAGSVGKALPGVDVKIHEPNQDGVGEVIAKGPNIMAGYANNIQATEEVLKDGWLHTGDLGKLDDDGNLTIVGRKKEMILGASGENIYPDELEELYRDNDLVKECSVVGLPSSGVGEVVSLLMVPDFEFDEDKSKDEVKASLRSHVKAVSAALPPYKRAKVFYLTEEDLPKTATRKVKRREVVAEIQRLERAAKAGNEASEVKKSGGDSAMSSNWLPSLVAKVAQCQASEVKVDTRLEDLGLDSLMVTELGVALEAAGVVLPDLSELSELVTFKDLDDLVARQSQKKGKVKVAESEDDKDIEIPEPLVKAGRQALSVGQDLLYRKYLKTKIIGKTFVPPFGGYLIAANHASHLDMGLVKQALGDMGGHLVALAAKDYFFEDQVRKFYFEHFTNLVPMERHGSLRESLRLAGDTVRAGHVLLIFPEGTRSISGEMIDFKPSLGYLAMSNVCGILPMYLAGTRDAMKKGDLLPRRKTLSAHVGPFQSFDALKDMTKGMKRAESYRFIATHIERMVRGLCPKDYEWTLGAAGREPMVPTEVRS